MTKPETMFYWERPVSLQRMELAIHFLPRYVYQLMARPYRRGLPPPPISGDPARNHAWGTLPAFDACIQCLVDGYARLAEHPVLPQTGRLVVLFMRLMAAFNKEYEHRLETKQRLDLEEILADPLVAGCLAQWTAFTVQECAEREVVDFLSLAEVAAQYERYVAVTCQPDFHMNVAAQMASIELDSGYYCTFLARLVGLFHRRLASEGVLNNFRNFGMAGKLVDELVDLPMDYFEGRYNLLLAMLFHNGQEQSRVMERLAARAPMPASWWTANAPLTFRHFTDMFEVYYRELRCPELRIACNVSMMRALSGRVYLARLRNLRHVSKSPDRALR